MKLIDNINDLLGDDIKQSVQPGARLKIAASTSSIYAFEFIFTSQLRDIRSEVDNLLRT